jgi:Tfp pilus assembly protein PilF
MSRFSFARTHAPTFRTGSFCVAVAFSLATWDAGAQEPKLGRIDFPTSGSVAAQPAFVRGVLYLHSFEYESAAQQFRDAQRLDPGFAMAYWGEAMTYTHPVWMQQDLPAARAALARLAPTREARRARAPTDRERRYLDAVEILYGDGNKERRDTLYSRAMAELSAAFPADDEARAFHALSLLGLQQHGRDTPNYMRAAALMEEVFARNPQHPGAVHYLIHAYDDPAHAPLGLRAARAYGDIAPAAGHALHMTTHIFVAMGMWDDVISANVAAWEATKRRNGHYTQWLQYGYLQQARHADARRFVQAIQRDAEKDPTPYKLGALAQMLAGYVIDTEDWNGAVARYAADSVPPRPAPQAGTLAGTEQLDFIVAWAAIKRGDPAPARSVARALDQRVAAVKQSAGGRYVGGLGASDVMATMLRAAMLAHEQRIDSAIVIARDAATRDESYPFEFGPPESIKPAREYLGELLLDAKRPAEARTEFERALRKTPNRSRAVLGLARACAGSGDGQCAAQYYARLAANWSKADGATRERAEAERYLAGAEKSGR